MASIFGLAVTVILISISGVMSPGPLFASDVAYGTKGGWKAGIRIAYGHTIIELPLIVLLGLGAFSLSDLPQFREYISILGAISLFAFAALQIREAYRKPTPVNEPKHGPILIGMLLTGLNPFFLIWWFTIGLKIISDAVLLFSFVGIGLVFVFHIWMDYAWLGSVAFLSSRGKKITSPRNYKVFMNILSGLMIYFGASFLVGSVH